MMRQALRRAMACFLLAAVLSTAAVIPASAAGFRDVPSGHWAAESIERCVSLGFFQGKSASQFGMGEEMTRSAFAVVLCRFFGCCTSDAHLLCPSDERRMTGTAANASPV